MLPQQELLVIRGVEVIHALLNLFRRHYRIIVHRLEQFGIFARKVKSEFWAVLSHQLFAIFSFDLPRVDRGLVGQGLVPDRDQHWIHNGLGSALLCGLSLLGIFFCFFC